MTLEKLVEILNKVIPGKVFYGTNAYDNEDNASMPFIVFQEISKKAPKHADNKPLYYVIRVQITLVTKKKSPQLERTLESILLDNQMNYSLLSEFFNSDKSLNRVYEINMEEFNYAKYK